MDGPTADGRVCGVGLNKILNRLRDPFSSPGANAPLKIPGSWTAERPLALSVGGSSRSWMYTFRADFTTVNDPLASLMFTKSTVFAPVSTITVIMKQNLNTASGSAQVQSSASSSAAAAAAADAAADATDATSRCGLTKESRGRMILSCYTAIAPP